MSAPAALRGYAERHGVDPARLQVALDWQVALWAGEGDDTAVRRDWADWLAADAANRRAWEQVERMAQALEGIAPEVGRHTLKPDNRISRRRALGLLGLAGAGVVLGPMLASSTPVRRALAEYRSGVGERRRFALPDGSSLILNTDSAVDLDFSAGQRHLTVLPGSEIALDSRAVDDPRPLSVSLGGARLQPGQAHALLRDVGGAREVGVLAGTVTLSPGAGQPPQRLAAGQRARLSAAGVRIEALSVAQRHGWTEGVLQADRLRLEDFLTELGRYRHGLLYCDDQVADLVLSGAYPLRDTDYVLESLVQALPIAVHYRTPWLVRVSALS
ncbi:hypothetical protein CEK62_04635 [Alcanivorax sp. N3-2A]|nr:hypothetical protein CEK62_04635 [Alcanivorax sp. N3-2A]|tara:strand:- start:2584 stop:3573 length:990 start_codon:yes stop_codon:yes gene_type:complete